VEAWILANWPFIFTGLVSIGIVVGTIKAVMARFGKELTKISRGIEILKSEVHTMELTMVKKDDCEKEQAKCGRHICTKIDQLARQYRDDREAHREDREVHRDDIRILFEKLSSAKDDFVTAINESRKHIEVVGGSPL